MLVRKVIYSILNLFDHHKEKIPNLFLQIFKKHPNFLRKDKQRIRVCVNEIIRYLGLIDHLIELGSKRKIRHINPKIINVLRLGIYELVFDDITPDFAAIHSSADIRGVSPPSFCLASSSAGILFISASTTSRSSHLAAWCNAVSSYVFPERRS